MSVLLGTVASARTETSLVADTFTGTDGAAWDSGVWPFQRDGTRTISTNRGSQTGGSPGNALTDQVVTDCEILVKVTFAASIGNPEIGWRISASTASGTPGNGYVVQFGGSVQIFKISGYSSVGSSVSGSGLASTTQWVKVRVVGTSHKVRWWTDGGAEPGTWQIDTTDSTYTEGVMALRQWGSNTVLWDDFAVTDLASPATPAQGSMRGIGSVGGLAVRTESPVMSGVTDVTWTCWFRENTHSGAGALDIAGLSSGSRFIILTVQASGELGLIVNTGGNTLTGHTVSTGTWYYLATTRTASGVEIYYATGVNALTKVTGSGVGQMPTGSSDFRMINGMLGQIAAVKVWTAKLTQVEIEAERSTYAAVKTSSLWATYPFNTGVSTADSSGNSRTLTLTGALAAGSAPSGVS